MPNQVKMTQKIMFPSNLRNHLMKTEIKARLQWQKAKIRSNPRMKESNQLKKYQIKKTNIIDLDSGVILSKYLDKVLKLRLCQIIALIKYLLKLVKNWKIDVLKQGNKLSLEELLFIDLFWFLSTKRVDL